LATEQLQAVNDLPITLYDLTEDPFAISIRQIDLEITPQQVAGVGSGLVFVQQLTYFNSSDRLYSLPQPVGGGFASVLVQLPPGALLLSTDNPDRYVTSEAQDVVVDTLPVLPGEHTVELIYFLPYDNGAIIDIPQTNAIDGTVNIAIAPATLTIVDDRLTQLPADPALVGFNRYTGTLSVGFGETWRYEIAGSATPPRTDDTPGVVTSDQLLPLLAGAVLLLALLFAAGVFLSRRRATPATGQAMQTLISQIADLDALHNAGQINHDVYQRQRQELKTQLARLMSGPAGKETPPDAPAA
ncbi:MAG: hypothetical protein MUE40_09395, partial [Anaerolineae bacterium]|nr:hypothetical protein [Anaerolineae bacterium]